MANTLCRIELPDLERRMKELGELSLAMTRRLARTAYQEIELIMTEAKEITPVDTGNLRNSGHVQLPKTGKAGLIQIEEGGFQIEFGFGGPAGAGNLGQTNDKEVGYAVEIHENLTLTPEHQKAAGRSGQAKYLEKPVTEHQKDLDIALVGALEKATRDTIKP